MSNSGRTSFEALLVTMLVGILLLVAINTFTGSIRLAREVALISELGNIRTSVSLYRILKKHNPKNLREMVSGRYLLPYQEEGMIKRSYLETASVDKNGNPLDPFGNLYLYEERIGRVRSSTKGYEGW